MKRIALLGGTSWPSTIEYYTKLNQLINQELGGHHSCPMILYNIDYHEIKSGYANGWNEIPGLLKTEIENILKLNPDGLIICNNTLHKAFDLIKNEMHIQVPVFHIIDLTKTYILENNWQRVLLLGTKFTMEDDFFKQPLIDAGIQVEIPDLHERIEIQEIQSELAKGIITKEYEEYFQKLTNKYVDYDAFILACTELPLAFEKVNSKPVLINTITLQCQKAIEFIIN
ncbi:aspartate/glutamate racemase family protein [Dyadobacter sp. NIV53]|uniref:aspartate/glutamate racemase family protein n=1 Tax=Dyadobacter sp. NIV53 TaxID=2861765 RepID=UPI001C87CF6B|nr:amino acid racemase [Dyadobacter sp. NIV53]